MEQNENPEIFDSKEDAEHEIESLRQDIYKDTCYDLKFCLWYCCYYHGGCDNQQNESIRGYDYTPGDWRKILEIEEMESDDHPESEETNPENECL
jgi:hypothetical protein